MNELLLTSAIHAVSNVPELIKGDTGQSRLTRHLTRRIMHALRFVKQTMRWCFCWIELSNVNYNNESPQLFMKFSQSRQTGCSASSGTDNKHPILISFWPQTTCLLCQQKVSATGEHFPLNTYFLSLQSPFSDSFGADEWCFKSIFNWLNTI